MKNYKIKSYCKINLYLKVIKKLNNGYHNITSLITFCDLHDIILISKSRHLKDTISFSGRFKRGIDRKLNTVTKVLDLLRKKKLLRNEVFKINVHKNIPHGSGLGGGSSNAANLLNYFNSKMDLRLDSKKLEKLAGQIGFDVPVNLKKKNSFVMGQADKVLRLNHKFKLNLLIVYPNLVCSTKKIYSKNNKLSLLKSKSYFYIKKKKLIEQIKNENNDLEKTVVKIYPKINKIINYIKSLKGCYFSRITGSGSACFGIFSNMKNAIYAKKLIKVKYPKYWCIVSKSI